MTPLEEQALEEQISVEHHLAADPMLGPELGSLVDAAVSDELPRDTDHIRKLESRAVTGAVFIAITTAAAVALRLLNSIVFSHLFIPKYFGLLALVTAILVGINLFSHLGLQDSVVQNPRGDDPDFLNTAWTLQLIRAIGVFLVCLLFAWPAARFYHESQMIGLLPLLGFSCIIGALSSSSLLTMARHIQVRELTLLELFSQFTAFAATITWGYFSPTVWALAGGRVISEVIRTAVSFRMMPEIRPKLKWDPSAVREIIKFGKWILVGSALTFLSSQSDRLILGKLIPIEVLALYGIAYAMSDLPRQIIGQFCSRVGFPFIAKFMDRPRPEFRQLLLKYRGPVLLLGAVLLSLTVCTGDLFITRVYNTRYHGAGWMVGILTVGLWHTLLYSTISPAIFALQKSHYSAIANFLYCVALFIALPLGFHYYGMLGAVVAVALSDLPMYFFFLYSALREGLNPVAQDLWTTAAFLVILSASVALRYFLGFGMPFPTALY